MGSNRKGYDLIVAFRTPRVDRFIEVALACQLRGLGYECMIKEVPMEYEGFIRELTSALVAALRSGMIYIDGSEDKVADRIVRPAKEHQQVFPRLQIEYEAPERVGLVSGDPYDGIRGMMDRLVRTAQRAPILFSRKDRLNYDSISLVLQGITEKKKKKYSTDDLQAVINVACAIALLDGDEVVNVVHVAEALQYVVTDEQHQVKEEPQW